MIGTSTSGSTTGTTTTTTTTTTGSTSSNTTGSTVTTGTSTTGSGSVAVTGTATTTTGAGGGTNGSTNNTTTTGSTGSCTFTVDHELSSAIATVGIVNWSTTATLTNAEVQFGPAGGALGMAAPVDVAAGPNFRTLLLGMKGERDYDFQIVATTAAGSCSSETYSLTTGPVSNSVPVIDRQVANEAAIAPGFIITSGGIGNLGGGGGGGSAVPAFILDHEGDVVWWAPAPGQTSRAKMDWEGANMWMMALNVGGGMGEMRRVSMDGLDSQNDVTGLGEGHHDFTVAPGGIVTAIVHAGQGAGGCSAIIERAPDGTITPVVSDVSTVYQPVQDCHPNSIHYHPADDSYTVSDRNPNLYVKVTRQGTLVWQFGGNNPLGPHIPGSWQVNHGHHVLDNGNFLFFNNGAGMAAGSPVIEFEMDYTGLSANEVWRYSSTQGSATLGDVQRLPNGNTVVAYSNNGVIHEVDASGQLVQSFSVNSIGYVEHRPTLYGPPPR